MVTSAESTDNEARGSVITFSRRADGGVSVGVRPQRPMSTDKRSRIVELLTTHGPMSTRQIRDRVAGRPDVIAELLKRMVAAGQLKSEKVGQAIMYEVVA